MRRPDHAPGSPPAPGQDRPPSRHADLHRAGGPAEPRRGRARWRDGGPVCSSGGAEAPGRAVARRASSPKPAHNPVRHSGQLPVEHDPVKPGPPPFPTLSMEKMGLASSSWPLPLDLSASWVEPDYGPRVRAPGPQRAFSWLGPSSLLGHAHTRRQSTLTESGVSTAPRSCSAPATRCAACRLGSLTG